MNMEVNEESIIPPTVPDSNVCDIIEYGVIMYGVARINSLVGSGNRVP